MAVLKSKPVTRKFVYERDGVKIELPDFNPGAPAETVIKFYSGQYPELTNASIRPEHKDNEILYVVETQIGTKG